MKRLRRKKAREDGSEDSDSSSSDDDDSDDDSDSDSSDESESDGGTRRRRSGKSSTSKAQKGAGGSAAQAQGRASAGGDGSGFHIENLPAFSCDGDDHPGSIKGLNGDDPLNCAGVDGGNPGLTCPAPRKRLSFMDEDSSDNYSSSSSLYSDSDDGDLSAPLPGELVGVSCSGGFSGMGSSSGGVPASDGPAGEGGAEKQPRRASTASTRGTKKIGLGDFMQKIWETAHGMVEEENEKKKAAALEEVAGCSKKAAQADVGVALPKSKQKGSPSTDAAASIAVVVPASKAAAAGANTSTPGFTKGGTAAAGSSSAGAAPSLTAQRPTGTGVSGRTVIATRNARAKHNAAWQRFQSRFSGVRTDDSCDDITYSV